MTLLFHCDESFETGRCHFHLGILSNGEQTAAAENALRDISSNFRWEHCAGRTGQFELHGADIYGSSGRGWFAGVPREARIDLYRRVLSVIPDHGLEVIYKGIDLAAYARSYSGSADPHRDTTTFMFEDIVKLAAGRGRMRGEPVLVVTDEAHSNRAALREGHARSAAGSSTIVGACHFVDSEDSLLVQLADMAAFMVRRRRLHHPETHPTVEAINAELMGLVTAGLPGPAPTFGHYRSMFRNDPGP